MSTSNSDGSKSVLLNPFVYVFLTILVTGYAYLGSQLISPLELSRLPTSLIWLLLIAPFGMIVWLPAVYWQKDEPMASDNRWLWAAYGSMAFLSFLLFFVALRDLLLLAARAYGFLGGMVGGAGFISGAAAAASGWFGGPSHIPLALLDYRGSVLILCLSLICMALGFQQARRTPAVTQVDVPIEGLPEPLSGLSIAQISDLHIGSTIHREFVEQVVATVNALTPDLVALTGDIVDGTVAQLAHHFEPLSKLQATLGIFYVTGNHEFYWDVAPWIEHIRASGIKPLLNTHVVVERGGAKLVIAGVLDLAAKQNGSDTASDPAAALQGAPADAAARILLAHQPKTALAAVTLGYDLELSGHTHGGQFLPWTVAVGWFQPFVRGLHRVGRMWLYVSRGTGYWGPPVRLGSPSEITLIRLVRADQRA